MLRCRPARHAAPYVYQLDGWERAAGSAMLVRCMHSSVGVGVVRCDAVLVDGRETLSSMKRSQEAQSPCGHMLACFSALKGKGPNVNPVGACPRGICRRRRLAVVWAAENIHSVSPCGQCPQCL
ncbi:hypothetical protein PF005_g8014 [Phytophthora fragariae]|uniref:Uncharacterized protein n=1 Tax=Phytophthora fragariae TaxID=53985 RepID=A0A6A3YL03_9STRA|nr:hypothetical protein PF003_g22594 [Phytophthora fragariae]KAE9015376.1 hypothetical protein PF011_g7648 [Phytophthora fragariae]KAE9120304.1 hypothetical protein PF010_g7552 [Phytophthora fragariae]KAE9148267.1 hypothetical protein PF006_g7135 [Phytophthora fragariae]KAE9219065.1 hypothetical protein PF005_g8014 [Phytophthora fragariae]